VNASYKSQQPHSEMKEVVFAGGIHQNFIRSSREYGTDGKVKVMFLNTGFDVSGSGQAHSPRLCELPDLRCKEGIYNFFKTANEDTGHASSKDDPMREPGAQVADQFIESPIVPIKFISGDDCPFEGREFAINVLGTTDVLTVERGSSLMTIDNWFNRGTQRFRCELSNGNVGFKCIGEDGVESRFMGCDRFSEIICAASTQREWEYFDPRVLPTGGFKLRTQNGAEMQAIGMKNQTPKRFQIDAPIDVRFGFTRLDNLQTAQPKLPVELWGVWPSGSDRPSVDQAYAITMAESELAFTVVNGTKIAVRPWKKDNPSQRFRLVSTKGYLGFVCDAADNGSGRYLSSEDGDKIYCDGKLHEDLQNVYMRPHPDGGFTIFMKPSYGPGLISLARTGPEGVGLNIPNPIKVVFKRLEKV
jgi:hypothetical protein